MIIPIRCMNCGNILADKWLFYQQEVKRLRGNANKNQPIYMDGTSMDGKPIKDNQIPRTPELEVLEHLKLRRYCCRKHMLTHVDLLDKI